ncbi:hypothetical protein HKBW3S34_01294, partial [Candidatus Hakubella thermalkaliphila]
IEPQHIVCIQVNDVVGLIVAATIHLKMMGIRE